MVTYSQIPNKGLITDDRYMLGSVLSYTTFNDLYADLKSIPQMQVEGYI